ncbi:MAG: hypothetical protein GXO33_02920 [Epsilonproteobacteria bacterium]|nr:hypothetical protein [Campylobacterota bacterium]
MKIELRCRSKLLRESLKRFLKDHQIVEEGGDLIVCDEKIETRVPSLRIGTDEEADLIKPFTRSQLLLRLEELQKRSALRDLPVEEETLEEKIEAATTRFVREIVKIVKQHGGAL